MAVQKRKKSKKRIDWRRMFVCAIAALLALALILPLLGNLTILAQAVSQDELRDQISSLKADAEAASAKKKELEEQLQGLVNDQDQAMKRKELLDQQLMSIDQEIASTEQEITTYKALIAVQEEDLKGARAEEEKAYQRFCARARAMEEAGKISYWSVILQSSSFSDLLDRLAMVNEIVNYDNLVIQELAEARSSVEEKLKELNDTKAGLDAEKAVLDGQRSEQASKVEEAQALFDALKQQAATAEELVKAEEAEQSKIAAQIAIKEKELEKLIQEEEERRRKEEEERKRREEEERKRKEEEARRAAAANQASSSSKSSSSSSKSNTNSSQSSSGSSSKSYSSSGGSTSSSGWVYPVPGFTRVTSEFGYRIHPITGKPNSHTGIDISASGGTPIKAASGGVVTVSSYAASSYGEYVVISHGNGKTTLYAHMQRGSRKVREGDTVSAGQVIGLVGMTGSATGNHLHLEYKVNGVRKDPRTLFPGIL